MVIHENIGYMTSHIVKFVHITTFPRLYTCQKLDENYITKDITWLKIGIGNIFGYMLYMTRHTTSVSFAVTSLTGVWTL